MTLTAYPCKLSAGLLEARLEGHPLPRPQQVLCLNNASEPYAEAVYCQVDWVAVCDESSQAESCCRVGLKVLHGAPGMTVFQAIILEDAQIAQAAHELQAPVEHPLHIGGDEASGPAVDFFRLGPLTLVEGGSDSSPRVTALMQLLRAIQPYQRLLVIDPLGVAMPSDDVAHFKAGDDWRLALQKVGGKRFLEVFAETLPDMLREAGLRTVASLLPQSANQFVSFQSLMALETLTEAPLRNLILQTLHALGDAQVFAERADQVLDFSHGLPAPITVLDVSDLPDPWKGFFYTEVCRSALKEASGEMALALIHPEIYLPDWTTWIRQASEQELNFLAVPSPSRRASNHRDESNSSSEASWKSLASNVFRIANDGHSAILQGDLTLGLPVRYALTKTFSSAPKRDSSQPKTQPKVWPEPFADVEDHSSQPSQSQGSENQSSADNSSSQADKQPAEKEQNLNALEQEMSQPPESDSEFPTDSDEIEDGSSVVIGQWSTPTSEADETDDSESDEDDEEDDEEDYYRSHQTPDQPQKPQEQETWQAPPRNDDIESYSSDDPSSDDGGLDFDFDSGLFQPEWQGAPTWQAPAAEEPAKSGYSDNDEHSSSYSNEDDDDQDSDDEEEESSEPSEPEGPPEDENPPVITRTVPPPKVPAGYHVGERVRHPQYGPGVIMKILPMADQVILNITFEQVGKRLLDPSLCQLTRDGDDR